MSALTLSQLRRTFGDGDHQVVAVDQVDLTIERGEIVALLGPNGAGKTTTLDMVLGFSAPSAGTVEVFGGGPRSAIANGQVAAVLQTGGLLRDLTVRETVELIASTYDDPEPIDAILARVGIGQIAHRMVSKCSGGEQQRLRFALALLPRPELLIFDEPTAGLDVDARHAFWETVIAEADRGTTIVFATHYLNEAEQYAQRTVVMAKGRIVADGPTAEVRQLAAGTIITAIVPSGSPTIEWVDTHDEVTSMVVEPLTAGVKLVITATDGDAIARQLLNTDGTNLSITTASLDEAFSQLVADPTGA